MSSKNAFTLIELIVVVIITGIIASFAIPNYQKAMNKNYARDAVRNLYLIGASQQAYKARYGTYAYSLNTTAAVNAKFGLNIVS